MLDFLNHWIPNIMDKLPYFYNAIIETFVMLILVGLISLILGGILGVILVVTRKGDILENKIVYFVLGKVIDFFRAIPFVVLAMLLLPYTRALVGTSIGVKGAIIPLIVGTTPFMARQIESAIAGFDRGLVEASQAMGSSPLQIIYRVYLRESIPGIIRAITITLVALIGFITMVGTVGAGGIGAFCIQYGYNAMQLDVLYVTVLLLVFITILIQGIGSYFVKKTTH